MKLEDLQKLAEWKVNLVRLQIAWFDYADSATKAEYDAWLDETLLELDTVLATCVSLGIKIALDLHTPPGGFVKGSGAPLHRVFKESWAQQALVETWQKIATRYLGNSAIYGYDLLNEPAQASVASGLLDWNQLAQELVNKIREIDPVTNIIIEPVYGDRTTRLKKINGTNLIYSVHMYYPLNFISQGVNGRKLGLLYPTEKLNRAKLAKWFKRVSLLQKKLAAQKLLIGEFTAVRWAPKNSSYKYLRDVIKIIEKNGWDWSYHAFREENTWSVEHGSNKDDDSLSPTPTNRELLLRSYFVKNSAT